MRPPETQTLYDLFNDRVQFQIPVYQRAYVWTKDANWSLLWDDIVDVAERHLEGSTDDVRHFLGPIVLEQRPSATGGVDPRLVIDGQQRLTTLQVLLTAAADVSEKFADTEGLAELNALRFNAGKRIHGEDRYKVRPSRRDRDAFKRVIDEPANGGDASLEKARAYFATQIEVWVTRTGEADEAEREHRLDKLRETIGELLYVVAINLDDSDNAQVIFETLNARGTGLGALDLVKNTTLLRAGTDAEQLNDGHWEPTFEQDDYWAEDARQGREKRTRSDWLLVHWLAMKFGDVVRADKVYDVFNRKLLRDGPPMTELVPELCRDAAILRGFDQLEPGTPDALFFERLDALDTTTLMPIALLLFRSEQITPTRRARALSALESWLVRRAILKLTASNYNRQLARLLSVVKQRLEEADDAVIEELKQSQADTARWPDDDEVRQRLEHGDLYYHLTQKRVRMLLEACERHVRDPGKTEGIAIPEGLTIEHAMPQGWQAHWPLPEGVDHESAAANRWARIHRLGNLTLVTGKLNASLSNAPWTSSEPGQHSKRQELKQRSVLLINQRLVEHETWAENNIDDRGRKLTNSILSVWPGPSDATWASPTTTDNEQPS